MTDYNQIDFSGYVMRMLNGNTDDPNGLPEISVFVHIEVTDEEGALCEECFADHYIRESNPEVESQEPGKTSGVRYWVAKEIAQHHDWPHSDLTYCGHHLAEAILGGDDYWDAGVKVEHYNVPSGVKSKGN